MAGHRGGTRLANLDALRLAAAFGVMALHVTFQAGSEPYDGSLMRYFARWCVPFFFLATGIFLPPAGRFAIVDMQRVRRLLLIILMANLIFLPLGLKQDGLTLFSTQLLISGTFFHFWFLSALLLGLLFMAAAPLIFRRPAFATLAAISLVVAAHATDMLNAASENRFTAQLALIRHFQSFAFLWLGFLLGTRPKVPRGSTATKLIVGGAVLNLLDYFFSTHLGIPTYLRQFPLGTVALTLGLAIWGLQAPARFSHRLAAWGRDLSLLIYIIHPVWLMVAYALLKRTPVAQHASAMSYVQILLGMVLTFAAALTLKKYMPAFVNILRGRAYQDTDRGAAQDRSPAATQ